MGRAKEWKNMDRVLCRAVIAAMERAADRIRIQKIAGTAPGRPRILPLRR